MASIDPSEPPDDRFCDLVMKGGITSGVVYPAAIELLSHQYRFKNIGGTSAGAIAAAVTAAAEFNRRVRGSRDGFDVLKGLSAELQQEIEPGRSRLLSLFQPDARVARLFAVLTNALNRGGTYTRLLSIGIGFMKAYWLASAIALAIAVGVGIASGAVAGVLALVVGLAVSIGVSVYRDVTRHMVANGFGLCTGLTAEGSTVPALTPWLHDLIQRAAGLPAGAPPLTFGMLWRAPGMPADWVAANPSLRSIDLQMFSTNLSQGRPYIFPLAASDAGGSLRADSRLFFTETELARYLPGDVFQWMLDHGKRYVPDPNDGGRDPGASDPNAAQMIELPPPEDFPVVLAARMSLSFPVLFAGVPLWAINYNPPRGKRHFRRCWFSDGGLSSNFPMHLFDGLVPSWPTFGIDLEPVIPERELVYLPTNYAEGYGERWNGFDEAEDNAARCGGFFSAMIKVMQNWNDNALSRMPGVRDRIARVRLSDEEGGLNLNMPAKVIDAVTARGVDAVKLLIDAFATPAPGATQARGWDDQRWIRLCVLLKMIEDRAPGVERALSPTLHHATDYETLIQRAGREAPPGFERPLTATEQQSMRNVINALGGLVAAEQGEFAFQAVPKPAFRVRPPL